jgi:hypothetical protein
VTYTDRVHFYAIAAQTMRRILIDYARARAAEKRGGERERVSLSAMDGWNPVVNNEDLLDLDRALSNPEAVMVIFGAPEEDPYQEENALKTAVEMQAELQKLADKWRQLEGVDLRIGIGINSGPAIVGNIGSSRRMEYTAIGDTVNLASRLETATKELGVGILLSEYTHNAVRGSFRFRNMGPVRVRGRNEPVLTYSIEEFGEVGASNVSSR